MSSQEYKRQIASNQPRSRLMIELDGGELVNRIVRMLQSPERIPQVKGYDAHFERVFSPIAAAATWALRQHIGDRVLTSIQDVVQPSDFYVKKKPGPVIDSDLAPIFVEQTQWWHVPHGDPSSPPAFLGHVTVDSPLEDYCKWGLPFRDIQFSFKLPNATPLLDIKINCINGFWMSDYPHNWGDGITQYRWWVSLKQQKQQRNYTVSLNRWFQFYVTGSVFQEVAKRLNKPIATVADVGLETLVQVATETNKRAEQDKDTQSGPKKRPRRHWHARWMAARQDILLLLAKMLVAQGAIKRDQPRSDRERLLAPNIYPELYERIDRILRKQSNYTRSSST